MTSSNKTPREGVVLLREPFRLNTALVRETLRRAEEREQAEAACAACRAGSSSGPTAFLDGLVFGLTVQPDALVRKLCPMHVVQLATAYTSLRDKTPRGERR
jgi:hypothetical protein